MGYRATKSTYERTKKPRKLLVGFKISKLRLNFYKSRLNLAKLRLSLYKLRLDLEN